jgi:hypothetical protein
VILLPKLNLQPYLRSFTKPATLAQGKVFKAFKYPAYKVTALEFIGGHCKRDI